MALTAEAMTIAGMVHNRDGHPPQIRQKTVIMMERVM